MLRTVFILVALMFGGATYAMASDVACCRTCCKGANCIMTHKTAHDCLNHPPCK